MQKKNEQYSQRYRYHTLKASHNGMFDFALVARSRDIAHTRARTYDGIHIRLSLLLLLLVINSGCCFFCLFSCLLLSFAANHFSFDICSLCKCIVGRHVQRTMTRVHTQKAHSLCVSHILSILASVAHRYVCLYLYICVCCLVSRFDDLSVNVGILSIAATTAVIVIVIITNTTVATITTPSQCQCVLKPPKPFSILGLKTIKHTLLANLSTKLMSMPMPMPASCSTIIIITMIVRSIDSARKPMHYNWNGEQIVDVKSNENEIIKNRVHII